MLDYERNASVQSMQYNNIRWKRKTVGVIRNRHGKLYHLKSNKNLLPQGKGYLTSIFFPLGKEFDMKMTQNKSPWVLAPFPGA